MHYVRVLYFVVITSKNLYTNYAIRKACNTVSQFKTCNTCKQHSVTTARNVSVQKKKIREKKQKKTKTKRISIQITVIKQIVK